MVTDGQNGQKYSSRPMAVPPAMGVDHGRDRGDKSPPEFGAGDANVNCPPQILSYRYKNVRSVAFKICQNPFSAGALPRSPLGELTTLPQTP